MEQSAHLKDFQWPLIDCHKKKQLYQGKRKNNTIECDSCHGPTIALLTAHSAGRVAADASLHESAKLQQLLIFLEPMVFASPFPAFWHALVALHDEAILPMEPPDVAPT